MGLPKNKNTQAPDEKVILEAVEPLNHDGQATAPGKTFLADPADVEALLGAGLAKVPEIAEETPAE